MVTQQAVAKRCGMDVSSVCKILSNSPDAKFKTSTIKRVEKVARELGYRPRKDAKPLLKRRVQELEAALREVVPNHMLDEFLSSKLSLSIPRVQEIKGLIYGKSA